MPVRPFDGDVSATSARTQRCYAARRDDLLDAVRRANGAPLGLRKDTSNLFRDPARA